MATGTDVGRQQWPRLRVVRLCSVFEVPPAAVAGRGAGFDPLGGMQNHTGQLTRVLDRHGVAQTVVTAYRPGAPRRSGIGERTEVLRLGVPVTWARQLYSAPAAWQLPRLLKGADLLHAHLGEDLALVPLALSASAASGVPFVMTIHSSIAYTLGVTDARSALLKAVGGPLERLGERRAAAVITLTARSAELIIDGGVPAERVHVIPSGIDLSRFDGPYADVLADVPRPRVVFVGRLHPQKGAETLVAAAGQLPASAHVVLVGDGPQRGKLEALSRRLGIGDRVHFRGFVPPSQVPAVLAGADVFVLPSRYEELGSVLLEAMSSALPIVASNTGGIPDVIADGANGLLVPPADPRALAAAVVRLLDDPALGRCLGTEARARVDRYDWNSLALQVLRVYEAVLTRSARQA